MLNFEKFFYLLQFSPEIRFGDEIQFQKCNKIFRPFLACFLLKKKKFHNSTNKSCCQLLKTKISKNHLTLSKNPWPKENDNFAVFL